MSNLINRNIIVANVLNFKFFQEVDKAIEQAKSIKTQKKRQFKYSQF